MGRIVEHHGYSTRIFWNKDMLDFIKANFATMLNEELADCLGVSMRTMIRKARELGLQKDPEWLGKVWNERRIMAHVSSKRKGFPGGFVKGVRNSPDTEFKAGHQLTDEQRRKQSESMKRWYRFNRTKASEKALKAWITRRKKEEKK